MYKIIGGDGQEYGPVTEADLCKWIAEGRLNAKSLAKAEGEAEFRPLSTFPEFSGALGTTAATYGAARSSYHPVDWRHRDYELDIGGCISRGWNLIVNNFGILFGSTVLSFVVLFFAYFLVAAISAAIVAPVFSLETRLSPAFQIIQNCLINIALSLVIGPLFGGLYFIFIQTIRGEPSGVGQLFAGFQKTFPQLFLGCVVIALANSAFILPPSIMYTSRLAPVLAHQQAQHGAATPEQAQEMLHQTLSAFTSVIPVFLVCLVPLFYLYTNFLFVFPLIIDKGMDFWTAIKASWLMVHKHWFTVFGLAFLTGLINFAGFCLCCIPVFFTFAFTTAACMFAYETIFGESRSI